MLNSKSEIRNPKSEISRDEPLLSVVIPVYNERPTIEELLIRVQAVDIDKEIVVVDDGSTDGTREFLEDLVQSTTSSRNCSASACLSPPLVLAIGQTK